MGDDQDGAFIGHQVLLQPGDGFGVKVVGRFVKQQHIRCFEQQFAQRYAAAFTPRQGFHIGIIRGATKGVHRDTDGGFKLPQVARVDLVLQGGHFIGRLIGVIHRKFVVPFKNGGLFGHAEHDVALHVQRGIKVGLLRQVAHLGAFGGPSLTLKIGINSGHDAQQGRFARAVDADNADLDAGQEVQVDILEAFLAAGIGL